MLKMRVCFVLCALQTVMQYGTADVSHLSKHYLPPGRMMMMTYQHGIGQINDRGTYADHMIGNDERMATMTTIEKQILKELPEQIEYAAPAVAYPIMMDSSMHDMVMMNEKMPSVDMSPPLQYLPPQTQTQMTQSPSGHQQQQPDNASMLRMQSMAMAAVPEIEKQQMIEFSRNDSEPEPEPAHRLTSNGYEYKTSSSFPTVTAANAAMKRRFRLRQ